MSLFAGTSFLAGANDKPVPEPKVVTPPVEAAPSAPEIQPVEAPKPGEPVPPAKSSTTGTGQAAWSAALRFAPAAASRKPKAKPPVVASMVAARIATTSTSFSSAPTISAPPIIRGAEDAPIDVDSPLPSAAAGEGKKIFRPPAMTLDQGEAFAASGRKRGAPGQGGGKKKKWKKNKQKFDTPQHIFIPDEPYNPAKPNDLQEWREFRKTRREERRREREERARREGSEKSWYSEDEDWSEEEVVRRDAPRAFAPPTSLYAPQAEATHPPPPQPTTAATTISAPSAPVAIRKTETADEVYARRLAMSTGPTFAAGPSHPAPVARPPPPSFVKSPAEAPPPSVAPTVPSESLQPDTPDFQKALETRRLAAEAIAKRLAASFPQPTVPGIGAYAGPVQEPRAVDTSGMEAEDVVDLLARQVERDAGGDKGTFAERMMRKMGHVEGQGLGRTGDGIIHALAAEHVVEGKKKQAAAGKGKSWTQAPSAKGRLVNMNEQTRQREERARYGEPSRIVCLVNVLGSVEEADQETMEDLGEKLKEHGIVERLVPHSVYPPPSNPNEAVRIFAVFSGPAGAWKALKDLDSRFFGGRQISAKFFDEKRFESGDWDGPVVGP
ncbi:hypothetical protein NCC49_002888 [Naganishia albida]|nr:hypothetical protein NCC49_002888 [Naganishia albida]